MCIAVDILDHDYTIHVFTNCTTNRIYVQSVKTLNIVTAAASLQDSELLLL